MNAIGQKIRKIREQKGYSQDYVSSKLSISQNAYSKIENGGIKIDHEKLEKIASVLEMEIEDILSFNEHMIFYNCKQSGNILQNVYNNPISKIEALYDDIIKQLREENAYLREQLSKRAV